MSRIPIALKYWPESLSQGHRRSFTILAVKSPNISVYFADLSLHSYYLLKNKQTTTLNPKTLVSGLKRAFFSVLFYS